MTSLRELRRLAKTELSGSPTVYSRDGSYLVSVWASTRHYDLTVSALQSFQKRHAFAGEVEVHDHVVQKWGVDYSDGKRVILKIPVKEYAC